MDGHDVGRFQFDHIYNVPERLGRYLIAAGYGEIAATSTAHIDDRLPRRRQSRKK
jgi:hypothetical protein